MNDIKLSSKNIIAKEWDLESDQELHKEEIQNNTPLEHIKTTTIEEFYEQRKSKMSPINIMLSQRRKQSENRGNQTQNNVQSLTNDGKIKFKIDKMNWNEKIEGEELFDFNK